MNFPYFYYNAGIRMDPGHIPGTLKLMEKTWTDLYPEYYYQYEFLDDHLAGLYRQEEKTFTLFKIFSGISIFIGCPYRKHIGKCSRIVKLLCAVVSRCRNDRHPFTLSIIHHFLMG